MRHRGDARHWALRVAPGEEDVAARISRLRERLRARSDSLAVPDLKQANVRGGGTAQADDLATLPVTWKRLVDVASASDWSGRVLYRAAVAAEARHAVEVGTNIGMGACYIAAGLARNGDPRLTCLDGAPNLLAAAADHVDEIAGFRPITREGVFAESVVALADELADGSLDLVFIDGEHYYDATLRDASLLIPKLRDGGIAIFDDIAWNDEMERAWRELATRPDCAEALEPRVRGSRRLGLFVKGPRAGAQIRVFDSAPGPPGIWVIARRVRHLMAR